jgi:hypothetical protein
MLFLQCGECGFRTVPGTLEFWRKRRVGMPS